MAVFVVRRIVLGIISLIGVLVVTFALIHLAPIDSARMYAGPRATPQQLQRAEDMLGLSKPLPAQLGMHIYNFFRFDWGVSLASRMPVTSEIAKTLPYTIELVFFGILVQVLLGTALGVMSAHRKDQWPDHLSRIFAVGLIAVPTFWLALGLQYMLTGRLHILPLNGAFSYETLLNSPLKHVTGFPIVDAFATGNLAALGSHVVHMVMPVIALACMGLGAQQRLTRSAMIEVLSEDFIVATRSYGMPERVVLWRHGLKNSTGVVATFTALSVAWILVNTFIVEAIFGWPGVGNYIVTAVSSLDYPVVIAVTALSAVSYLVLNAIADVIVAIDPRVRAH